MMPDDGRARRINGDQFIFFVNCNEDVPGNRIKNCVPGAASQWNGGDQGIRGRINHGISVSVLVGNKYSFYARSIRNPVGILDGPHFGDDLQALHLDHRELVLSRRGRVDTVQFRNGQHSMHAWKSVQIGDDFPFPYIEDHKLVRIHVRDVQPRMSEIEALIIETNGWPGKRNVGDLLKRRWRFLSKCRSAKENRGSDQATDSRTGDLVAHKTTLPP